MASLNSIEGRAHVVVSDDNTGNWGGYFSMKPDPLYVSYFDIAGPRSHVVYEGPVLHQGKYYIANGEVTVTRKNFTSKEFRVDFESSEKFNIVKVLKKCPADFIQE
jgi:hypothetical protein